MNRTFDRRLRLMQVAIQLCDPYIAGRISHHFSDEYLDDEIVQEMLKMAPKIEDTMIFCRFRDKLMNCSELFIPTLTEDGVCYAFNLLNNQDMVSNE